MLALYHPRATHRLRNGLSRSVDPTFRESSYDLPAHVSTYVWDRLSDTVALSFSFFFLAALLAADRWNNTREDGVIGIVGVEEFFLSAPRSE